MRNGKRIFSRGMAAVFILLAAGGAAGQARADYIEKFEFGLQGGYRLDQLDWNIAGNLAGENPNILSELIWSDLMIYQVETNGQLVSGSREFPVLMRMRWNISYGWIVDGSNRDSDYGGDDRTLEFSRSTNNADKGYVVDGKLGVGPYFASAGEKVSLSPLVGYAYNEQNLTITDGYQTIDTINNNLGPFSGLYSTYEARWWGPWLGMDLAVRPASALEVITSVEFHFVSYNAKANWNLRTDLAHPVSFEQWGDDDNGVSDGLGTVLSLTVRYFLSEHWLLSLGGCYQEWQVENGLDRVYLDDGSFIDTRLNEVNWQSWGAQLGLVYRF